MEITSGEVNGANLTVNPIMPVNIEMTRPERAGGNISLQPPAVAQIFDPIAWEKGIVSGFTHVVLPHFFLCCLLYTSDAADE